MRTYLVLGLPESQSLKTVLSPGQVCIYWSAGNHGLGSTKRVTASCLMSGSGLLTLNFLMSLYNLRINMSEILMCNFTCSKFRLKFIQFPSITFKCLINIFNLACFNVYSWNCSPDQVSRLQHSCCACFLIPSQQICCFSLLRILSNHFPYFCCRYLIYNTASCSPDLSLRNIYSRTTVSKIQEPRFS